MPTALAVRGGDAQQGVVGAALPDELAVAVLDAGGAAMSGVAVRFVVVAGGGQVAPETATTDGQGVARARWTLGTAAADSQVIEAQVEGITPLRLRAQVRAAAPATLTLVGGTGGAGPVGNALADSLAVTVADRYGNPVAGSEVSWAAVLGGGSISPERGTTGAGGVAKAAWTLGPRVDSVQIALARVAGLDSVAFTANAVTAGAPLLLSKRSGDGQRGPAGGVLVDSLGVLLRMPDGRPVRGAVVSWSVPASAGTVTPAVTRTDASGAAATVWRLGSTPGLAQVSATVDEGVLTFTSLTEADAPATVTAVSGGGAGGVGQALADSLAVRITDRYGNPAAGAVVDWTVTNGGGSVSPARSAADANGIARAQWTLGPVVGTAHAARATVTGMTPVAFSASATTRGVPLQLIRVSGDGQTGEVWKVLPESLTVELRTQAGVPVRGATVTWAVTAGEGTIWPRTPRTTDAHGRARVTWTPGKKVGAGQVTATVDDGTLTFSSMSRAAAPHALEVAGGQNQNSTRGTILPNPIAARVLDFYGNSVPGAWVRWRVTLGAGHVEADSSLTGPDGTARTRWAMGIQPGRNTVTATAGGSPAKEFTALSDEGALRLARLSPELVSHWRSRTRFNINETVSFSLSTPAGAPVVGAEIRAGWTTFRTGWTGLIQYYWETWWSAEYDPYSPPALVLEFEDQFIWFAPDHPGAFDPSVELSYPDRAIFAGDSVPVRVSATHGWYRHVPGYPMQLVDDTGWRTTAVAGDIVLWPVGSQVGSRRLEVCAARGIDCDHLGVNVLPRP